MFKDRRSQHSFAQTPATNAQRSVFNRSFNIKDTQGVDLLYPIMVDEVLPGDTLNLTLNSFARLATQQVPVMDNIYMDYFFFFVPNRLVWTNWEKFCGAQDNPGDSISYTVPTTTIPSFTAETAGDGTDIASKFGIPPAAGSQVVNALPFRAYNLIWNTWFCDENIQSSIGVPTGDGPDTAATYYQLRYRGKRKDYLTSVLPWPQKGTALTIPTGSAIAPVRGIGITSSGAVGTTSYYDYTGLQSSKTGWIVEGNSGTIQAGETYLSIQQHPTTSTNPNIYADVGASTLGTINELRQAFQIQSMLELDARGGTRYVELLLSHFNVVSPDFRLQRPEYLGGGEVRVNTHPVPQTSATSGSNYQAALAAFGTAATTGQRKIGFSKSFVEHGYIIGLCNVRADITYQRSINRMWKRSTRYDFFWPKLQELGEQPVYMYELYAKGDANDTTVFGYQERYAEYRYKPSEVHGYLNSNFSSTLDVWHCAQNFTSLPSLNSSFISSSTPLRILANPSAVPVIHDMFFEYICARPMKTYSVPAHLGRF